MNSELPHFHVSQTLRLLVALAAFFLLFLTASASEVNPYECGARSMGMGGAWLTAAQGISAIRGNTSLLLSVQNVELSAGVADPGGTTKFETSSAHAKAGDDGDEFSARAGLSDIGFAIANHTSTTPIVLGLLWQKHYWHSHMNTLSLSEGGPSTLSLALATEVRKGVGVGGSWMTLFGREQQQDFSISEFFNKPNSVSDNHYSGSTWNLGVNLDLDHSGLAQLPVNLGFFFRPKWEYAVDQKFSDNEYRWCVEQPMQIGLGTSVTLYDRWIIAVDAQWYGLKDRQIWREDIGRPAASHVHPYFPIGTYTPLSLSDENQIGWNLGTEVRIGKPEESLFLRAGYFQGASFGGEIEFRNLQLMAPPDYTYEIERRSTPSSGFSFGMGVRLPTVAIDLAWARMTSKSRVLYTYTFMDEPASTDQVLELTSHLVRINATVFVPVKQN